ncbi:hypothetical protein ACXYMO_04100 [Arenibacterium sp. CAU 1754]
MTAPQTHRGGAPVGYISDLDAVEASVVLYLRLWHDGAAGQSRMWNDFARLLGPKTGRRALRSFEQLCGLCARHGRRPFLRHDVVCKCLGADEACLAQFISAAAQGDRKDAMLIATLLVRADVASSLVALAEAVGLALQRMTLEALPHEHTVGPRFSPVGPTLH